MLDIATDNRLLQILTIEEVVKNDLCTGCGTCISICPNEAIELTIDGKKGIYIPKINKEKCNNCGICYDVCPGHSVNFKELNMEIFGKKPDDVLLGNYLNCYTGHATDYDIRYNSASGGLVTQLLIFALEGGIIDGVLVTRMSKENPLEPEPFIARTNEEIIEASKSKYCPVPVNIALKKILESKEDEKFAVVGLPCHIHGIRKVELINQKLKDIIVLHVGIFCAQTIDFLGNNFLLQNLEFKRNDIKNITYRGGGWPGGMTIELKDGSKMFIPMSEYYYKFTSFVPARCSLCSDHACEFADVSCGDAWLPKFANDTIGTSIVISRSEMAEGILQSAASKGVIELTPVSSNKVAQSQGMFRTKKSELKVHILLYKLLRKNVPVYDMEFLKPELKDYVKTTWHYFWSYVAHKRFLWPLLTLKIALVHQFKSSKKKEI